jgi:hypothetical protein
VFFAGNLNCALGGKKDPDAEGRRPQPCGQQPDDQAGIVEAYKLALYRSHNV